MQHNKIVKMRKLTLIQYHYLIYRPIQMSIIVPLMPLEKFFLVQSKTTMLVNMFLQFLLIWSISSVFFVFYNFDIFKNTGHLFCRMSLRLVLSSVIIRFELHIFSRNSIETMFCSSQFISEGTWCRIVPLLMMLIPITW